METQEFFKEWESKYPKSFDEFFQFLDNYFFEKIGKALFSFRENDNGSFDIMLDEYELPFEMLTGVINKFYRENKIIITENYDRKTKKYLKTIFSGRNSENEIDINDNENYKELNYDCFLYAAEILEKELS